MGKRFLPSKKSVIGIVGNLEKNSTFTTAEELIRILERHQLEYAVQTEVAERVKLLNSSGKSPLVIPWEQIPEKANIIISLGGDGTILRTAKLVAAAGIPILGINLGKLGFLAEVSSDELEKSVDELFAGRFNLEERTVLRANFLNSGKETSVDALNDIVIDKAGSSRMIDLETYVDNEYLITYRGDGLVLSTPTGSTGYCLSTGGPIITPASRVIAISPISPHTLSARPVVVPDSSFVRVIVRSTFKNVMITADGQVSSLLSQPAEVAVALAPYKTVLLRKSANGFFNLLRTKLMWGVDIRSSGGSKEEEI
ncbi:MAG: NAD(+)/NADH kinase [Candidatus Kryptoniota bacterium]